VEAASFVLLLARFLIEVLELLSRRMAAGIIVVPLPFILDAEAGMTESARDQY
jgi:hypothetical protein